VLRLKGSTDRLARHLRYVVPLDCCCMTGEKARCNKYSYPALRCFSFPVDPVAHCVAQFDRSLPLTRASPPQRHMQAPCPVTGGEDGHLLVDMFDTASFYMFDQRADQRRAQNAMLRARVPSTASTP
jgi:hypothetical protein